MLVERIRLAAAASYERQEVDRLLSDQKQSLTPEAISLDGERNQGREQAPQSEQQKQETDTQPAPERKTLPNGRVLDIVV